MDAAEVIARALHQHYGLGSITDVFYDRADAVLAALREAGFEIVKRREPAPDPMAEIERAGATIDTMLDAMNRAFGEPR